MLTTTNGNGRHKGNGSGKNRISGKAGGNGNGHSGNGKKLNFAALTLLAMDWERKRDEAKRLYAEADGIEQKIINRLGIGNSFVMKGTGRTVVVNNNFVDAAGNPRTVAFKPCGVKAVEVKIRGGVRTVKDVADDDSDDE